jgi:hypothetical protein
MPEEDWQCFRQGIASSAGGTDPAPPVSLNSQTIPVFRRDGVREFAALTSTAQLAARNELGFRPDSTVVTAALEVGILSTQ